MFRRPLRIASQETSPVLEGALRYEGVSHIIPNVSDENVFLRDPSKEVIARIGHPIEKRRLELDFFGCMPTTGYLSFAYDGVIYSENGSHGAALLTRGKESDELWNARVHVVSNFINKRGYVVSEQHPTWNVRTKSMTSMTFDYSLPVNNTPKKREALVTRIEIPPYLRLVPEGA